MMIRQDVGVRRAPDDSLPMDEGLMQALRSYEVGFNLIPLPKTKGGDSKGQASSSRDTDYGPTTSQSSWTRPQGPYSKGNKGKGKGKQKSNRLTNILPKELANKGCVGADEHNRRFCFNFNFNKCQAVANGAQCPRGWHLLHEEGVPRPA